MNVKNLASGFFFFVMVEKKAVGAPDKTFVF